MLGHTALVTGATEGIGREVAFTLGRAGWAVGVTARTPARVADLVRDLTGLGIRAAGYPANVADPSDVERLVPRLVGELGPIDTLINNAGIMIAKPFEEMPLDDFDAMFATNVRGLAIVTRAVLPGMLAAGRGDIINIASLAGKHGVSGAAAYSASKHAVLGLSRSLMLEFRARGIRVIAICPGSVDTPMMRGQSRFDPDFDRILSVEDVARAVLNTLELSPRATVSELDLRPSNP